MKIRFGEYMKGIPTKPYDLIKEGLIVLGVIAVVVIILAAVFSSPDYPTITAEDVASRQPLAYVTTCANILAGNSGVQDYGPPYSPDTGNAQRLFGIAPADWFGVTIPIDPPTDFILKPLQSVAVMEPNLNSAIATYEGSTPDQQQSWSTAYLSALPNATVQGSSIQMPPGDYGPVPAMMEGMLNLGQAGLLEGALAESSRLPFNLDFTSSLLFFQDDVFSGVADKLNLLGDQWGMSNETGNYPGAWWTWPVAFLYQIPAISNSPNADIIVMGITLLAVLIIFLLPFIPLINRLPYYLGVHHLIWRDWYSGQKKR
jgi:hypothetical protein